MQDFKDLANSSEGELALLNSNGYWLSSEDQSKEWNFMFEDQGHLSFSKLYPQEWDIIKEDKGQIVTENGLFTFVTTHLNHHYQRGDTYQIDEDIVFADEKWHIVSLVDDQHELGVYFSDQPILTIINVFQKNSYQLILIAGISGVLSLLVYLNRKKYYAIKYYSEHDPLTQTLNRRAGYDKINNLIYQNERRKDLFSLCFIDVNGLKQVNDHLGHEYGDELLTTVCDTIRLLIREYDFIIRQGGDEFIIVFDRLGLEEAEKVWQRIVSKFDHINKTSDRPYMVSVSHGIIEHNNAVNLDIDELIQQADEKMYQEKEIMKATLDVLR